MNTMTRRQSEQRYEAVIAFLVEHPLATRMDIEQALGLTTGQSHKLLETMRVKGLIARQPNFGLRGFSPVPSRWQVVPR